MWPQSKSKQLQPTNYSETNIVAYHDRVFAKLKLKLKINLFDP